MFNENWNSRENKHRRIDAAWEQALREWNTWKDDIQDFLFKPLAWAIATPVAFVLAVWLVQRIAE